MYAPNVWLITGSSGGFGSCIVKSVLARGDRVIATARSLDKIPTDFPDTDALRLLELDITAGEKAISEVMKKAVGFWGRIDVLVNNAGYGSQALVEEGGGDEEAIRGELGHILSVIWADLFCVPWTNVFGTLDVTAAVLPYMRKERSGTIVMIGSRTSWRPELPVLHGLLLLLKGRFARL
ncbi:NAD(P)-binding protein [Mycena venus]|uniref:NAD(P)-binding protein n=1 Tax=Mycena venus TaxID=2733690 RepID=A0A8H6YJV6_9AGAR|nr:NAD(P)-binding protein [Mycena venus]